MMPYIAIDIETTGLDDEKHQILEIGAVFEPGGGAELPLDQLPTWRCFVKHETYTGQPYALAMNSRCLYALAEQPQRKDVIEAKYVALAFAEWLKNDVGYCAKSITPAGKNFAVFDYQFLKRVQSWKYKVRFKHRMLDPATLWWNPAEDLELPDMATCCKRAGIEQLAAHEALDDAMTIVKLVRAAVAQIGACHAQV